ncbi:MAG: ATP-dependent Clp protease proteolytic subunit, partial [Phycisphaerae bacterium]
MTSPTHPASRAGRYAPVVWALAITAWTVPTLLAEDQLAASESPRLEKAAILPIQGEITDVMATSLERRIEDAREQGAKVIVFDMDTPGGLVTSSIAVADLIKNVTGVKTVAWVNPNAHSGGSIIAVACDEIVMARSSRMGDSQVIMG